MSGIMLKQMRDPRQFSIRTGGLNDGLCNCYGQQCTNVLYYNSIILVYCMQMVKKSMPTLVFFMMRGRFFMEYILEG